MREQRQIKIFPGLVAKQKYQNSHAARSGVCTRRVDSMAEKARHALRFMYAQKQRDDISYHMHVPDQDKK